jgi:hypothetical protein
VVVKAIKEMAAKIMTEAQIATRELAIFAQRKSTRPQRKRTREIWRRIAGDEMSCGTAHHSHPNRRS